MRFSHIFGDGEHTEKTFFIIFFIAMIQLLMTVIIPVSPYSNPTEIYLRNISSIGLLFILSFYFFFYNLLYTTHLGLIKIMKSISVILAIASIAKVAISSYFCAIYLLANNIVGYYYLGEAVAWIAIAFFAIAYFLRLRHKSI